MRLHLVLLVWWLSALSLIGGKAFSTDLPDNKKSAYGLAYALELETSIVSGDALLTPPLQVPGFHVQLFMDNGTSYAFATISDGRSSDPSYPLASASAPLLCHSILINAP